MQVSKKSCTFAAIFMCRNVYKRVRDILFMLLVLLFGSTLTGFTGTTVRAQASQQPGVYGNEFWLGFLTNNSIPPEDKSLKLSVYAVAEEAMTINVVLGTSGNLLGQITIPAGGGMGSVESITPNAVYPKPDESETTTQRGIRIYATEKAKKFTCYAVSETGGTSAGSTRDATILLPTDLLGSEYFVQTYPDDGVATEFLVVATEDNTDVTIVPTCVTYGNAQPGVPITIYGMSRGQTYQVKSAKKDEYVMTMDLSGSTVCATKPVAVFNGNESTKIPDRGAYSPNHTFEQVIPQTMWGKEFYVSLADGTKRNMVQVTASIDGTVVTVTGPGLSMSPVTLNRGESLSDPILLLGATTNIKITATQPVVCYHYLTCGAANQQEQGADLLDWGNPTNALVVPWTHRTKKMSFYTATLTNQNTTAQQKYFVQVVTRSADKGTFTLDGNPVASSLFKNFGADGSKAYASIPIATQDVKHRLETSGAGFVGYVYGMTSEARAYEYTLGFDPPVYVDSLFLRDRDNPKADIMSPTSYHPFDSIPGKGWYQRQEDWWPIGQERLDTAYVCNGEWLRMHGQMALQNAADSVVWKIYKCDLNGKREKNPVTTYPAPTTENEHHYYNYRFTVDPQETLPPSLRDPYQLYAVDMERYKKHLICPDLEPECDTLRTMVKALRAYNDTVWRVVCEIDTVHFFNDNYNHGKVGPKKESIFKFNYAGSNPDTIPFHFGHNIWTRRYQTPNGCDSIVTLCLFGCDTSYQVIDTTVCEDQLTLLPNGYYISLRDKHGESRGFTRLTVKSQDQLRADAQTTAGIQPYTNQYLSAQYKKRCLRIEPGMPQTEKDTINFYNKYCSDFKGCPDTVILNLTINPLLYTPEKDPAIVPWCTGGSSTATYKEWKRANGQMVREITQDDIAFKDPEHPDIGYFRDTVWHDACTSCAKLCPKEITTLILMKVDNEPKVHDVHICRDESYVHELFMEGDRKRLNAWVIWDTLIAPGAEYYEESHWVDVKDAQGVKRCEYYETLRLFIHNVYADKGRSKFNTELQFKDTVCLNEVYPWEGHTEALPGEIHYVWDVRHGQRVPANNLPTDRAGTFEFVDSLKTKTCTACENGVGCDSIWRLTLIVGPEFHDSINYVLCRNKVDSFEWKGTWHYYYGALYNGPAKTYPNAKLIPDDPYLNTSCSGNKYFRETFSGQTRYGCDSTWTVKIHLDSTYIHTKDTFICEGTEYHFFDKTYVFTYDHTPGATNIYPLDSLVQTPTCGCDSGVTEYVHVRPVYRITEDPDTTCQDASAYYEWVKHPQPGDVPRQIWMVDELNGDKKPVMTNEILLDKAGTFTLIDSVRTLTCPKCDGKNGCDSVMSISLTIIPTYNIGPVSRPLSSELYFVWDDTLFMGSPTAPVPTLVPQPTYVVRVPGTAEYTHHYFTTQTVDHHSVGTHKCDSIYTIRIVVGQVFRDTTYAGVCSNCEYLWHMEDPNSGATKDSLLTRIPAAGETLWYHYNPKTVMGFDSVYNLCLTGFPTKFKSETAHVCQGETFVWPGHSDAVGKNDYLYIVDESGVVVDKIDTTTFNNNISLVYDHYTIRDSLKTDTVFYDPKNKVYLPVQCDSIWELELDVTPTYTYQYNYDKVQFDEDLCSNDTLLWNNYLWVGYDYDLAAHPIEPVSPATPYSEIIYIPKDSVYSYYDSVPYPTGTRNYRCDSINYVKIHISKYDTTHVRDTLGDNNRVWYFGGKNGTFQYIDSLGNQKDRVTVRDLVHDIQLKPGAVMRDTFLIDTLRLNGCDSIIWDSIFIFQTYEFPFDTAICSNVEWSWRPQSPNASNFVNLNYKPSGTYYDSLKTVRGGVDSVFVLHLDVLPAVRRIKYDTICKNDTIIFEHQTVYYDPNEFEVEVRYETGKDVKCDSVVVLRAQWRDYYHFKPDTIPGDTVCRYDDVVWVTPGETKPHTMALRGEKGEIFDKVPTDTIQKDASGKDIGFWMTIYDSLRTVSCNCDSTYMLRYYVRPAYHFHEVDTICSSDTLEWRGMELFSPHAAILDTADRYVMADGTCDSIYFLTLHINQAYDSIFYDTICANRPHFEWQGHNLDTWLEQHRKDTVPVDTFLHREFTTTLECDSLYKLYLTLWPILTDTLYDTICVGETYLLNGRPLTRSGIYYDQLINKVGCDSFVVLYLEVAPVTQFKIEPMTICADEGAYDMIFTFDEHNGKAPRELRIVYDSLAKANGFPQDTVVMSVTSNTMHMDLPDILPYVRPNHYSAKIYFDNGTCKDEEMLRVDFKFQVAYPSWLLEQHWMDAVGILNEKYNYGEGNEGYIFSAYQWYKNGEELVGQTRPYLYLPHLLEPGAEYSVGLVREGEDVSVMTCPITAVQRDNTTVPQLPYVSVVPTYVVKANPVVNILCSQHGGTYKLYNPFGSLIQSGNFTPGEHNAYEVKLPAQSGVYMFHLIQEEGEVRTVKVIVN